MKLTLKIVKITIITILVVILSILGFVGGSLFVIWNFVGNDKTYDTDNFYLGDTTFIGAAEAGPHWSVGFNKIVLTPEDVLTSSENYYIAGYNNNMHPKEVFDDIYVRALYLDDNTGRGGILFAVIDCVGISNKEIRMIRAMMADFAEENNIKSINVLSTHNHAGIDTQGLWGDPLKFKSGINSEFNESVRVKSKEAMVEAYNNKQNGRLYWGDVVGENVFNDTRIPYVYDETITRIRFEPFDTSLDELYIVSMGCHPEMMARDNNALSADFPAYMGRYIKEHTDAEFIFFTGAIGVLINGYGLSDVFNDLKDNKVFTVEYGEMVGEYVVNIEDTEEIEPILNIRLSSLYIPVENSTLIIGAKVNLIDTYVIKNPNKKGPKYAVMTEVGYMELGTSFKVALAPGELAPEWALGGFLDASVAANGYDMDVTPLFETMGEGKNIVFGLANDQIGYIIPDNDFLIHSTLPYINWANGEDGRQHYEETVSTGKDTGRLLLEEWERIISEMRG